MPLFTKTLNIQFLIISIYKIFPINRDLIIYIKHDLTEHGIYIYITTYNCFSHKSNFFYYSDNRTSLTKRNCP